jgi:hypothetical protein
MPFRPLLSLAILLLISALPVQALNFYVDGTPGGKGDNRRSVQSAQNPNTPFLTLTHALRIAHLVPEGRPHVIQLVAGTYAPSTGETFPLAISQPGIYLQPSGLTVFDAEGLSGILQLSNTAGDFSLTDIDFYNGRADLGGAIHCAPCSLRVVRSRFFENSATEGGQLLYARDSWVEFLGNVIFKNGSTGSTVPILELHDTTPAGGRNDVIRNNTFYRNPAPNILTSGNRTDIDSNIFFDPEGAAIIDAAPAANPLVRYNLFWGTDTFLVGEELDPIGLVRTDRDTLNLVDQGVFIPYFVTAPPDTIGKVGELYQFEIPVDGNRPFYKFNPVTLPTGMSAELITQQGLISWTPADADTGRQIVDVEIVDPSGNPGSLHFHIHVFTAEDYPAVPGPVVIVTSHSDTTGGLNALNKRLPVFSSAASAGGNLYGDPLFISPEFNRFELLLHSPAYDAGNPIVALQDPKGGRLSDSDGDRNNIGSKGGPFLPSSPTANTSYSELVVTNLPDSVIVEGQEFIYDPILEPAVRATTVDYISFPDFKTPSMERYYPFGDRPPIRWTPTIADTGSHLIGIIVWTQVGFSRHYFPLRVRPLNESPVVTSQPETVAREDEPYAYALKATDLNGDALTFLLVSGPEGMTIDPQTGLLTWAPTQEDLGTVQVEIRVDDAGGASGGQSFVLTVLNTNDPPVITSLPDTTAVEDSLYTYTPLATDPDPVDSITFSLAAAPEGMTIDPQTALISWIPAQKDVGTFPVSIHATDANGGVAEQLFTLLVAAVDDPPQISTLPDTTTLEDQLFSYAVQAIDEEGQKLTYALMTGPEGAQIDTAGLLTWTPVQEDVGVHPITVQVADPSGQTAAQTLQLTILQVNDPPQITPISPVENQVQTEPGESLLFAVAVSDEEENELTLSWLINGTPRQDVAGASLEYVPSLTQIDTLTAQVSDGELSASFTWIVDGRQIPRLVLGTDPVDFGPVPFGSTGRTTLEVTNEGNGPLAISAVQVDDLHFAANFSSILIPVEGTASLELRFTPTDRQSITGAVTFATDDPDHPLVSISVSGQGAVATRFALDLDPAAESQNLLATEIASGRQFTLALYAEETVDLVNCEAIVSFDPTALSFDALTLRGANEANLLDGESGDALGTAQPADSLLQVTISAPAGAQGNSGAGLLALLSFTTAADFAIREPTAVRLRQVHLRSFGVEQSDDFMPELEIILTPRRLLADFNYDGIVDFEDFFLFADHFGSDPESPNWDPLYDISTDGIIDFEDFFTFADSFGTTASENSSLTGDFGASAAKFSADFPTPIGLKVGAHIDNQVEIDLYWSGKNRLQGYAITLDFDPEILRFETFAPAGEQSALPWTLEPRPGRLTVAVGLAAGQDRFGDDLGTLRFTRLSPLGGSIAPIGALGYAESQTAVLVTPLPVSLAPLPRTAALYPPYPNPFNPETTLSFYLPLEGEVELRIYDLLGRPVRTLVETRMVQGYHTLSWDGRDGMERPAAAGLYLAELRIDDFRQVRKLLLLK